MFLLFLNYLFILFLIRPVITQIFNPIAELVIPAGTPTEEAKVVNASTDCNN